jgi:hypothetical protein
MAAWIGERRDMSFQASVASCASSMRRMSFISLASASGTGPAAVTGVPATCEIAGARVSEICEDARRGACAVGRTSVAARASAAGATSVRGVAYRPKSWCTRTDGADSTACATS